MKKFVVGYLSFFDNDVKLEKVEADSEIEAMKKSRFCDGYDEVQKASSIEEIQNLLENADSVISVIEV